MPVQGQGRPPAQPSQNPVNFDGFDTNQLKQHLQSRGLSTQGDKRTLVNRLKEEVSKAWSQYYAVQIPGQNSNRFQGGNYQPQQAGGPPKVNPDGTPATGKKKKRRNKKRKRPQLSDEERAKLEAERTAARDAKLKRKEENKRKEVEARDRKRLKREEAAKRQKEMEGRQKLQKENRQRSEVFVYFDMKAFSDQLMESLDKGKKKVQSCNYDFSHKGFRVRFNDPSHATACAQGATMKKPRTIRVPTSLQCLPAPVESRCVFFLDFCNNGHPQKATAFEWVKTQGIDTKTSDIKTLNLWKESSSKEYARFGEIVNIYRERGFIVIQFESAESAEQMFNELNNNETTLNGVPVLFLREGTPKKRDRLDCDKEYPRPQKQKQPKDESKETETKKEAVEV